MLFKLTLSKLSKVWGIYEIENFLLCKVRKFFFTWNIKNIILIFGSNFFANCKRVHYFDSLKVFFTFQIELLLNSNLFSQSIATNFTYKLYKHNSVLFAYSLWRHQENIFSINKELYFFVFSICLKQVEPKRTKRTLQN